MMDIIVPLRGIVQRLAVRAAGEPSRLVIKILQDQVHAPVPNLGVDAFGQFVQHMLRAVVDDGVDSVKPQPVQVELLDPIEGILDNELAYRLRMLAVVIDGVAPGRLVALGEEARSVGGEVVPVGAKVIVDHIKEDHQPALMSGLDQRLEILRAAISGIGRVGQNAVIAPVPPAGEIGDRHDLERGDAKSGEVIEPTYCGAKRAFFREGANVKLVEHRLMPGPPPPAQVGPAIGRGIDYLAWPMRILRLEARSRIRDLEPVRQREAVKRSSCGLVENKLMPALAGAAHGQKTALRLEREKNALMSGRPKAKADAALGPDLGAVRPMEDAAAIAWAGIAAGHRRRPVREAGALGRIRKRSSERPVT